MFLADYSSNPCEKITVVIPTFNRALELKRALEALYRQTAGAPHAIVVDNSSTDGTQAMIEELIPAWQGRLRYFRKLPEGPASARNFGLLEAATPYVLFQDSDVELAPDWTYRALSHLIDDESLAAVGGYVLYGFDNSRINAFGGDLGLLGLAWDIDEGTLLSDEPRHADRIWINCSAMLTRRDAIHQVGGFDDTFFYGYEDSDLGWRLNLAGYRVMVSSEMRVLHHVDTDPGSSHPTIVFHYCKNRLRSLLKNASLSRLAWMLSSYLAYTGVDLVLRGHRLAKLRALAWNVDQFGETLRLRREIQSYRRVSDRIVFSRGSRRWFPPQPLRGRRRRSLQPATERDDGLQSGAAADDRV
jgi:GT2 family glycosyltransferase